MIFSRKANAYFIPNLPEHWFIGGSAAISAYIHIPIFNDIDLFFRNKKEVNTTLKNYNLLATAVNPTYKIHDKQVQFINNQFHMSLCDYFESVDFTICQIAIMDGKLYYTEQAQYDIDNLFIRPTNVKTKGKHSISRIKKYMERGFNPAPGLLTWVVDIDEEGFNASTTY